MILNLLAVGDVVSDDGLNYLSKHLSQVKRLHDVHFTVVNGENGRPRRSSTPGPTSSPWATTPGTASRSPRFWTRTGTFSALPTTPAGYPAGAGGCTRDPGASASG